MNRPSVLDPEVDVLRHRVAELEQSLEASRNLLHSKLDLAAKVHRSLMPQPLRDPRIWADIRYVPIEQVGGDYCQIRFSDRHSVYFTIFDVTGHGIGPALLAAFLSSEIRYSILYGREPRDIVRSLNSVVCDHFAETGLYLTLFVARIDLLERTITWSGAGHPSPLLIRRSGKAVYTLDSQNPMIGIVRDILADTPDKTLPINSGDRLLFYTDGLPETTDLAGRRLGTQGIARIALHTMSSDLFQVADRVLDRVARYEYGPATDDKTLIVAEIR